MKTRSYLSDVAIGYFSHLFGFRKHTNSHTNSHSISTLISSNLIFINNYSKMTSTTASETTPLMRKFLNIEKGHHNKPFWYKAFKFACDNYKITIIGSMILHALMSLMIGFLMYSPANQPPLNPDYPRFSKTEFLIFLFVNLAAALPIILEYILDYRARDCFAYVVFRGNLIVTFTLPVVAKMLFMQYYDLNDDSTYMQFLCIFAQTDSSKAYFLLVTLLSLMFRAHVIAMDKDYSELKMRLSYGVVVIAFMAVTSKFLFMLSLITPFEMMFFSSSIALMYGELFLAAYLVGNILIYNFYNYQESRFNTHNQLNDVMKSSALFAYLSLYGITGIMVYGFGYNNYTFIIRVSLYMYLTLAYLVSVIPSVCTKKKMAIDEEKLKIRLNLIRYVSHEMRTPLNTAKLGVDMAMDDLTQLSAHGASGKNSKSKANPEDAVTDSQGNGVAQVQETLSLVSEACTVASVTLDDLLTFDKLDEQKLTIDVEDISPWKLLLDVAAPFHINAQEKRIVLTIDSVGDPNWHQKVSTSVDKFKMGQVIRNMISNAVKFTPPGGCVAVKLEKDEDNEMVKISVKDTGPGISAANQKKLFGQYVQFNAAQLQQGKGSGLGLWISKSKLLFFYTNCFQNISSFFIFYFIQVLWSFMVAGFTLPLRAKASDAHSA